MHLARPLAWSAAWLVCRLPSAVCRSPLSTPHRPATARQQPTTSLSLSPPHRRLSPHLASSLSTSLISLPSLSSSPSAHLSRSYTPSTTSRHLSTFPSPRPHASQASTFICIPTTSPLHLSLALRSRPSTLGIPHLQARSQPRRRTRKPIAIKTRSYSAFRFSIFPLCSIWPNPLAIQTLARVGRHSHALVTLHRRS